MSPPPLFGGAPSPKVKVLVAGVDPDSAEDGQIQVGSAPHHQGVRETQRHVLGA